ncbi:RagB/SusD family nutrient uptake outer membrane protein [Sphingobacterium sp. DN00404]|uniref:RagB/SusD family nutrient uptake outer membrane protein n=1 Tax=Sphingobacterium micropteri TaxID=2763501 RepID=A0ABR7YJ33_9SPHI|nr:RagB/SusD family nutrient uptake outer membrane protein [Sphingobacterium micropteri]MBD1431269.1 RagB/SusD family nutrient uptake outer membrane protein [Sphingobacterium micropteri]
MKRKYILVLLLAVSLSGCSDFLDKEPLGRASDEVILADENNIDMFVSRLYGTLNWREWFIGRQMYNLWEFGADDYAGRPGNGQYSNYKNFTYDPSEGAINEYWDRTYNCLNHCNQIIARTPDFENREIAELAEAQAKFFRAYYNFGLVTIFGEAPLRDKIPEDPAEYDLPKSSSQAFYELIIADLEYAIAHLRTRTEWGAEGLGRVTKGTAQGLLAKVYLYMQDYPNAQKYASDVIMGQEYQLENNYRELFSPNNPYSAENMMPGHYQFDDQIWNGRWWNPLAQYNGIGNGVGNAELIVTQHLVDSYENGDPRKEASIFEAGTDQIQGAEDVTPADYLDYANKKLIWPKSYWNQEQFSWTNVNPMFLRYADILLIYAEASNELGTSLSGLTAEQALEQVRFRARGNKTFAEAGVLPEINGLGKDAMRLAIWQERRVELAFEFQRWPDLVRYEKVVPGYMTNLLRNTYGKTAFDYEKHSKFPIPLLKINSSQGVLIQHDAWN